jgi:hypothetical protein
MTQLYIGGLTVRDSGALTDAISRLLTRPSKVRMKKARKQPFPGFDRPNIKDSGGDYFDSS